MFSQAFSLAVWESLFPACVVRGRANLLLSFHSAAPIPLQSLSVFSLLLAVAGQQEEAPSLFHISSPLKYPLDVVLPFSYIRGRFVYCPFFLVQFKKGCGGFFRQCQALCGGAGLEPDAAGICGRPFLGDDDSGASGGMPQMAPEQDRRSCCGRISLTSTTRERPKRSR